MVWVVRWIFHPIFDLTRLPPFCFFFFLNDPAPPEISPLPLHDALPISTPRASRGGVVWGVAGKASPIPAPRPPPRSITVNGSAQSGRAVPAESVIFAARKR